MLIAGCTSSATATPSMQPTMAVKKSVLTPSIEAERVTEIQIELYNPNRFEVRNAAIVLRIGEMEFVSGAALAPDTKSAVFKLTQEELDDLLDGDPISILYGPYETEPLLFFGRLQKGQIENASLRLNLNLVITKKNAAQRLSEIKASIEDAELRANLEETIGSIERSLDPELWLDPTRLDPNEGEVVFDHELEALEHLVDLDNSEHFPMGEEAMLRGIIAQIVLVDRGLAAFEIENRSWDLLSTLDVQQAKRALLEGDAARLEGDFVGAVESYREVWLLLASAE
jgi:hypothetical protein